MKFKDSVLEEQFVKENFHNDFKNLFGKFYYITVMILTIIYLGFLIMKAIKNKDITEEYRNFLIIVDTCTLTFFEIVTSIFYFMSRKKYFIATKFAPL
jgi:purine-cytosine permease-like protein